MTDEAKKGRRRLRWLWWTLGGLGGLVVVVVAGAYVAVDQYGEDIVVDALENARLPNPRLVINAVGPGGATVSDVRIGDNDELIAERIDLNYSITDLIDLDVQDLVFRAVRPVLQATLNEDYELSLGSLDGMFDPEGDDEALAPASMVPAEGDDLLPFREIAVEDGSVEVDTPHGRMLAAIDGTVSERDEGTLDIAGTVLALSEALNFDAEIEMAITSGGTYDGSVVLDNVSLSMEGISVQGATGDVDVEWSGDLWPSVAASLRAAGLDLPPDLLPPGLLSDDLMARDGTPGLSLTDVRVDLTTDGRAVDLSVEGTAADGASTIAIALNAPDLMGGGRANVVVTVSTSGRNLLWPLVDLGEDVAGEATVSASLSATLPALAVLASLADDSEALEALQPIGELSWIVNDVTIPGMVTGASSIGAVTIAPAEDRAVVEADAPLELAAAHIDPALLAGLLSDAGDGDPDAQARAAAWANDLSMTLEGRGGRPMRLSLDLGAEVPRLDGDLSIVAATGTGPILAIEATGQALLGDSPRIALSDAAVFAAELDLPGAMIGIAEAAGSVTYDENGIDVDLSTALSGVSVRADDLDLEIGRLAGQFALAETADGLAGPIDFTFFESGLEVDDVDIDGMSGDVVGHIGVSDGLLSIWFDEPALFRFDYLNVDGDVEIDQPSMISITPSETPSLEIDFGGEGGTTVRHTLVFGALDANGTVKLSENDLMSLALSLPQMTMTGGYFDGYQMEIASTGGRAVSSSHDVSMSSFRFDLTYDDFDPDIFLRLSSTAGRVVADDLADVLPPMSLRYNMTYSNDDVIGFNGRLADDSVQLVLDYSGRHVIEPGNRGSAEFDLLDLQFAPGLLQPGDLIPELDRLTRTTGTLDASGTVSWTEQGTTPQVDLRLIDVTTEFDGVAFEEVNGDVRLTELWPIQTAPVQVIRASGIDPGLPMNDAEIIFQIDEPDIIHILGADIRLAGGTVVSDQTWIDLSADRQEFALDVVGVELEDLMLMAQLDGIQATGKLNGEIPILVVGGDLVIPEAFLIAESPGVIRYDGGPDLNAFADENLGVDLLIDLIKDFQYDTLELRMMRPVAGDLSASFRILGRNPEVFDGEDVDLTLHVDGELEDLIRNTLIGFGLPPEIEQMILESGYDSSFGESTFEFAD